jgi:hypothetical protein
MPIHGIDSHSLLLFCFTSGEDRKKHMVMYIYMCVCVYIYIFTWVEWRTHGVRPLAPEAPTTVCWDPGAKNCHDSVLFGERCCITPIRSFVRLGTPGEGSQGHEASRHAAVLEFVPDGVGIVWASLLKEPLVVVCGCPCCMPVAVCGGRDAPHARAT